MTHKRKSNKENLNRIFIILLTISGFIYSLPSKFLIKVYSPSFLGWFLIVFLIPLILIILVWLSILDLKKNKVKLLIKRIFITIIIFSLSFGIKYLIKSF
jgi:hypothetical protein